VFNNSYEATGNISFSGTKEITGRDLAAEEFTFALFEGDDTSSTPFRTASNDIDGNFSFETINFNLDDVGVKTYTIVEQAGTLGGVDYDESVYTIIVSISDNGDGTLSIDYNGESDDPEAINFTNTYSATGSLDLSGTKTLTGRDLAAGEFTFELFEGTDTSGTPFSTASNDADGNFSFETISYNLADVGTRTYTIRELAGGLSGIIYDANTYTVIVNISDNGDGTLAVDITDESDDPDNISFINSVTAIIVEEEEPPLAEPTPAPLPTIKPIINIPLAPADPTLPTIEVVQEQLPKSGENAPLWPVGIALIAIAGGMAYLLNRKKRAEND
ncbi:MAG: LPXTG cell wall anchor domain-containing protein, partial [Clostridiaceae bacterium]|nr:LPXTG cell wall anchor domain-containing protein [Clostridiaceae bacterium]